MRTLPPILLTLFALAACTPDSAHTAVKPAAGPTTRQVAPGIECQELTIDRHGTPMRVWLYLPTVSAAGTQAGRPLPCVLIAPAGSRLFHGMVLEEGDRPEHLPWVRKGFAVVAFEIDGPLSDTTTKREAGEAIDAFRAAHAGIDDAKAAFDFAAARPEIDEKRIYIVGHSSAATLALQAAEHDPRIAACVAFAPACDLATRLEKATAFLDDLRPGTMDFLTEFSPDRHAKDLACPTMLFTARDDTNVPSASVLKFANQLQATNPRVKVITVNSGGHTESMLEQGIPAAIAFLQSLSNGNQP